LKVLCLLIGLPGSGKSTYIKQTATNNAIILSTDGIREELFGPVFNEKIKQEVFKELIVRTQNSIENNHEVIVDTTFLNDEFLRKTFIEQIKQHPTHVKITAIVFDTEISVCLIRDKSRTANRIVGQEIIKELEKGLSFPEKDNDFNDVFKRRVVALTDKEFKQLNPKLPKGYRIHTRGTIIGDNQYKPDISIANSTEEVVCCIESSSSGDRKATLAELLQAEKYANDYELSLDLIICLAGNSKTSPTPQSQRDYLEPYFTFLKAHRRINEKGIKRVCLSTEKNFLEFILENKTILSRDFIRSCVILE